MRENFTIQETKDNKIWDEFVLKSYNKNYYSLSDVLELEKNNKKYFVHKKNEIIASFNLVVENNNIVLPKYSIYTPINYKNFPGSKQSSLNSMKFKINSEINDFLIKNFKNIHISFDACTNDIRPFTWLGYPDFSKGYKIQVKYTYFSNIKNLDEKNYGNSEIYTNSSETNRREIRNSLDKKYNFKELFSKEVFFLLKSSSYEIHKKKINIDYYEKIFSALEKIYKKQLVKMFVTFDGNIPVYMSLYSLINNKSIFLHSGRTKDIDNKNLISVFSMFKSFIHLSNQGGENLDFEGMNSPNNSKSKIKFGGMLLPYYTLNLNRGE